MTPRLALIDIRKAYGGVQALAGVSLDLRPGEVHALVGENGAGKSTIVRIISGAVAPDEGRLEVDGTVVGHADPQRMRALGIAPVYQQPALLHDLSVAENIALGAEPRSVWRRIDRGARRRRARALLDRAGAASIDPDAPARSLRMAEQQLVEIARALGADARVLVLDEPTAALPDVDASRLLALVRDLAREGVGSLYISHRLEEVEAIADRITILRDGQHVSTDDRGQLTRAQIIRRMVGRELADAPARRASSRAGGPPRLAVRGLGCRSSGVQAIDLSIRAGEILGLAGLVGAGRTELARTLFGLTPADEGDLLIDGRRVRVSSPAFAARLGLAHVPEDRRRHGVIGEMSVAANVSLASLGAVSTRGWLAAGAERARAERFVSRLSIKAASVDADVSTLSGGNQQKVALARWLATEPRALILDEPTQGVDIGAKAEIHRLIAGLADDGLAILLISSDLPELLALSDRIAVMREGRIAATLDRDEASPEAVMALALGHGAAGDAAAPVATPAG
jgi:rhamnose transport system ATP-binding protein